MAQVNKLEVNEARQTLLRDSRTGEFLHKPKAPAIREMTKGGWTVKECGSERPATRGE